MPCGIASTADPWSNLIIAASSRTSVGHCQLRSGTLADHLDHIAPVQSGPSGEMERPSAQAFGTLDAAMAIWLHILVIWPAPLSAQANRQILGVDFHQGTLLQTIALESPPHIIRQSWHSRRPA